MRMLAVAVAIGVCIVALAAMLWTKGGAVPPAARGASAEAAGQATGSPPAATDTDAWPAEVKLASTDVAQALGIELVDVESRPVSATVGCNGHVAFNQNRFVELAPAPTASCGESASTSAHRFPITPRWR